MTKEQELMVMLSALMIKNGNKELGLRLSDLADKSKKEIVDEMEKIISEIKTGDIKATPAMKDITKHAYRQLTS